MELKSNTAYIALKCLESSNRTFMELKYENLTDKVAHEYVLIVPLWN